MSNVNRGVPTALLRRLGEQQRKRERDQKDAAAQSIAALRAENEAFRLAAVKAVMPLEAMNMAGLEPRFPKDVADAIREGISAVRAALNPNQKAAP